MTQPWEETVGAAAADTEIPSPYLDCWHRRCPACGAEPKTKCTFITEHAGRKVTRARHAPCLARQRSPEEN